MITDNGEWIMLGTSLRDPNRLRNVDDLVSFVEKVGFIPLFSNNIEDFSVEEHCAAKSWWTGNAATDPWEWRAAAAAGGRVAYGKFFGGKAGFISAQWLPYFANYRRDGYDFDSLSDEGRAGRREAKIMELFDSHEELFSFEAKELGGFGKGGEKNFQGIMTQLQMKTYLVVRDFRYRRNKRGEEYGMSVAVYTTPERIFGYDTVSAAYSEEPADSCERIVARLMELYPHASEKNINKLI